MSARVANKKWIHGAPTVLTYGKPRYTIAASVAYEWGLISKAQYEEFERKREEWLKNNKSKEEPC